MLLSNEITECSERALFTVESRVEKYIDTFWKKKRGDDLKLSIGNNVDDILHKFNLCDIVHVICTN